MRFVPYQIAYLLDPSPRKGMVKARRVGGSTAVTADAVYNAVGYDPISGGFRPDTGVDEYMISASLYQAEDMLRECRAHLVQLETVLAVVDGLAPLALRHGLPCVPEVLLAMYAAASGATAVGTRKKPLVIPGLKRMGKLVPSAQRVRLIEDIRSDQILLTNGHRIRARPANPDTVRGVAGNLTFDEFGVMPHSSLIWAAAKPIVDPNLGNPKGYKLRLVGTPLGDDNMFYRLSSTDDGMERDPQTGKMRHVFSWHWVDVYRAIADGFPANVAKLRAEAGDEDVFRQEYCCSFLSAASRYISESLLDNGCMYDPAEPLIARMLEDAGDFPAYGGMDVARSATGDYSALVVVWKVGDVFWVRPEVWAERGVSFDSQKDLVGSEIEQNGVRRLCIDKSGLGMNMAEDLQKKYGSRVEPVQFTPDNKEDLVTRLKRLLEEKRVRIPTTEPQLRRDLLALKRLITGTGATRFDVERSRGAGHGDRAWALALALLAADKPAPAGGAPIWRGPKSRAGVVRQGGKVF
jgi:phage FluMu gp28-like protein